MLWPSLYIFSGALNCIEFLPAGWLRRTYSISNEKLRWVGSEIQEPTMLLEICWCYVDLKHYFLPFSPLYPISLICLILPFYPLLSILLCFPINFLFLLFLLLMMDMNRCYRCTGTWAFHDLSSIQVIFRFLYRHDCYVYHLYFYSYASSTYNECPTEAAPGGRSGLPFGRLQAFWQQGRSVCRTDTVDYPLPV